MRFSPLAAALAVALSGLSLDAMAQDSRDQEIAALRAQVEALVSRLDELEQRTEAQSDVNIDTAQSLEALAASSAKVETKGGIKVTSQDKKFEASLGGRIHYDAYSFNEDIAHVTNTTEFRRARLTLSGKAYGWEYKMEQDFAAGTNLDGLRDLYIAKSFDIGKLTIGHFKPYRSMEELTSSNEILMMERPFSSATGLFGGRQFQQGLGFQKVGANYTAGLSVFNLRGASGARNEGTGAAGRITWTPISTEKSTFHLGAWGSVENTEEGTPNLVASASYAGRRGPSLTVATTPGISGDSVTAFGLEAAGSFGPLFFQSEYARASFGQAIGSDQDVETFYVQGSWMLNGGHKPYKAASGVFGGPKVEEKGLWELTARYDSIENKDLVDRQARTWILGVNYYVNPNLRIMANYAQGENDFTGDETGQFALRTQFSF
ncbi:MAG: porin [Arenimonas sp.]|jgi:phosphate-selective porin OprO/OprP